MERSGGNFISFALARNLSYLGSSEDFSVYTWMETDKCAFKRLGNILCDTKENTRLKHLAKHFFTLTSSCMYDWSQNDVYKPNMVLLMMHLARSCYSL